MNRSEILRNGTTLTRENFAAPPSELGILPFWFWNGEMDEKEMEWQLREYKSKGIPGIFIHGRFGLKVPYVSDAWFRKVEFAVRKAKEIGLDAWIYDEMNWPSGTAERKVPTTFPHLRQRYLELVALNVDGPLFTFLEATDDRYVNTGDSHPIAAVGCTEEEFRNGIEHPIDLMPNLSFERVIPWEAPAGKWRLLYFLEKEVPYYIDALDPESTDRFIELTHEGYRKAVGNEFGATVPGFYTDEPAMHYYHVGVDNFVVPWTKKMFRIFRERRGYDLRPFLPALFLNMGPRTAHIRYDFWRTLTEQYSDSYYRRLREWCDRNGVLFTGHLLFEEWMRMHGRCEGNLFTHLKHMHIVGVDHLYPKIGTEAEPDQHVALKIASSAAHVFGSARLLCESMGGSYWDCSLERMKWMLNWEYVLGVNLFNNHGYHYSIEGERKRDWPPSQFYHHTWWQYYDRFTLYANRLSHLLSGGRHVAKALMLYPLHSVWTNYVPQERTATGNVIEADFTYLVDALLRLHYDYDIVDENILSGATTGKGRIRISEEEYDVLVLPPITHITRAAFDVIERFVRGGGTVIASTMLPVEFLESDAPNATKQVRSLFGVDPAKLNADFLDGRRKTVSVIRKGTKGRTFTLAGPGLSAAKPKKMLAGLLNECTPPDVIVSCEDVFVLHRRKDGFDVYFFVNTTQRDVGDVEVSFEQVGAPELWDGNTGETVPVPVHSVRGGRLCLTLNFPASESRIVVMKGPRNATAVTQTNLHVRSFDGRTLTGTSGAKGRVVARVETPRGKKMLSAPGRPPLSPIALARTWEFSTVQPNVLAVGRWKMRMEDPGLADGWFRPETEDSDWLSVVNGAWEMQLGSERDAATYPVNLWYRTRIEIRDMPGMAHLLVDGFSGSSHRLFVNGSEVTDRGSRSALDAEIREVDILPHLKQGENVIAVGLSVVRRTDGILDLLKIVGDFAVAESGGRAVIVRKPETIGVGDWTAQGYPFYSGTGIYRGEFTLPSRYSSGRLFLEANCGEDVLEVRINDGQPVIAAWHPYRLEVTDSLRPGKNVIELRVTNTLLNVLEGVRKPSGLLERPQIVHEHEYTLSL